MNIAGALSAGYTAKQILNFIGKTFPEFQDRIVDAINAGKPLEEILKYLSKVEKKQLGKFSGSRQKEKIFPEESYENPYIQASRAQKEYNPVPESLQTAAKFGLGAVAGYGLGRVLPKTIQAASGGLGISTLPSPAKGPSPMSNAPVQPEALSPEATARAASAETLNAVTPEFQQWANQQIAQGNEKPLAVALREFQEQKEQEQTQQNIAKATLDLQQQKKLQRQPLQPEAAQPLEMKKGSVVATPSGQSGLLRDFRQKDALIDADGKIHKVKKEDLIEVPENIAKKDYQSIAKQYFDTFPKEGEGSLSDALSVMAYDPESRQLIAAFPDSPQSVYVYDNVEPELYEEISSASTAPKTKGGTGVPGVWDVNVADSRGSPFKKISANKEKYPFRKLNVGYNMFGKLADAIKEMRKQARRKK